MRKEDRVANALLWMLGCLEELHGKGLVARSDDADRITPEGMKEFRKLQKLGFKPTNAELQWAALWFKHPNPEEAQEQAAAEAALAKVGAG